MRSVVYFLVLLLLVCIVTVSSNPYIDWNDPDLPLVHKPLDSLPRTYDFVVVGAGAGGCVVASRLARRFPNRTILVVEGGWEGQRLVGGRDYIATKTRVNSQGVVVKDPFPWTKYDVWLYYATIYLEDWFLNNTWGITNFPSAWHQHKVIGGNMACNGMSWIIPSNTSLDRWNVTGWGAKDIFPYYKSLENYTGLPEAPYHGTSGPIKISEPNVNPVLVQNFDNMLTAEGYTYLGDLNRGIAQNNSWYRSVNIIRNGVRDSSSVAMLAKTIKEQNNTFLATACTVTVVLFNNRNEATGVQCVDFHGKKWNFTANLEVILAAGTTQTPKILMNSGIGPLSTLNAFNKPHRVVNNVIGQKIMNQQAYTMTYLDNSTFFLPNFYGTPAQATLYAATGQGFYGPPNSNSLTFWLNSSHPEPDFLLLFGQGTTAIGQSLYSQTFGATLTLLYQVYKNATLNLTSSDPLANTTWQTNAFVNDEDVNTMVLAIKKTRQVMQGWPTAVETFPGPNVTTDAQLAASVRANGGILGHFSGSVPLGEGPYYPVDLRLRVKGVHRLRIADSSAAHDQISRGMMATACMFGARAADFIAEDHP